MAVEPKLISVDQFIRKVKLMQNSADRTKSKSAFFSEKPADDQLPTRRKPLRHKRQDENVADCQSIIIAEPRLEMYSSLKKPLRSNRKRLFQENSLRDIRWDIELNFNELKKTVPQGFNPCSCTGTWDSCVPIELMLKKTGISTAQRRVYLESKDSLVIQDWVDYLREDLSRCNFEAPSFLHSAAQSVVRVALKEREIPYCRGFSYISLSVVSHVKQQWKSKLVVDRLLSSNCLAKESVAKQIQSAASLIQKRIPRLGSHLIKNKIQPTVFLEKWFESLMSIKAPLRLMAEVIVKVAERGLSYIRVLIILFLSATQQALLQLQEDCLLLQLLKEDREKQNTQWGKILLLAKDFS